MLLIGNKDNDTHPAWKFDHFKFKEFMCPCCGIILVDTELGIVLERIRTVLGIPVTVNSGYRCPAHNAAIGGEPRSRHIMGMAADVTWAGIILNTAVDSVFRKQLPSVTFTANTKLYGIGWGKSFIHVDVDASRVQLTQWVY